MPTPSEQKALAFVAIVTLLGGAVRVLRAGAAPQPTVSEQQALQRQAFAAETSASSARKSSRRGRTRGVKADTLPHVVGGVASVPNTFARPDAPFARSPYGFPPPSPRVDIGMRAAAPPSVSISANKSSLTTGKVDLDVASGTDIEKLPRIGPALARRIVANRDSFGVFGSLEALRRVRGIGPATLRLISEGVVFSGK